MSRKLYFLGLLAAVFLATGIGCRNSGEVQNFPKVTLEYWGVVETPQDIGLLTNPYGQRHPKVTINYRRFREDEYKGKLLEAWALGQGPDLFQIPVTKLREYKKFITPMPARMTAVVNTVQGTIRQEVIEQLQTYNAYTPRDIQRTFIDTVSENVIIDNQIWALPHSIDVPSVFYNRDLLQNSNIPLPATTWTELIAQAPRISTVDENDNLVQSTIALGTTNNISQAFDILSTIMMQIGINMGGPGGVAFQQNEQALSAIQFYLSFAQPGNANYSWNESFASALDSFTAGKSAYFIGYPYHAQVIRQTNPQLDFDIIPMFEPDNAQQIPIYTDFWVTVVSKPRADSQSQLEAETAWQFLYESTQAGNVKSFLDAGSIKRLTALRELIAEQQADPDREAFAKNLLSAKSWYQGYNYDVAAFNFLSIVDNVRQAQREGVSPLQFIIAGASRINQTYVPPRE